MKNIILVITPKSRKYARYICNSIHWINQHKYPGENIRTFVVSANSTNILNLFNSNSFHTNDTIFHCRAAYPNADWMTDLEEYEMMGYRIINKPKVLKLTSDKLACSLRLQDHFSHPKTWEIDKHNLTFPVGREGNGREYILKPRTSVGQGNFVQKFNTAQEFFSLVEKVPGRKIVMQEFVPYTGISRVIVIGGKALPYIFYDHPTESRWKVSVCLNKQMNFISNPDQRLLGLAESIQSFIGGEINFIDIFNVGYTYERSNYVISEINTACSLLIHERKAKLAGHPLWNIHYRIAKYLVGELMEL